VELEQRVKTLEYEMKILKNEVQRTLLDIQEQILVHYYPALRTDETKPSEGTIKAIEELRAKQASLAAEASTLTAAPAAAAPPVAPPAPVAPVAAASPVAPVAPVMPAAAAPPVAPAAKRVSLEEIRAAQSELATDGAKANPTGAATLPDRGSLKLLEMLMNSAPNGGDGRDGKKVSDALDQLTKLNSLVDRAGSIEEALRLIQEGKLG